MAAAFTRVYLGRSHTAGDTPIPSLQRQLFWLHSLEGTPGVGDGLGDLACCDSWGRKESDTTELLN